MKRDTAGGTHTAPYNSVVAYLAGEWVTANLGFGLVFLLAGAGCIALGYWVIRGDRLNRQRALGEADQMGSARMSDEEHH